MFQAASSCWSSHNDGGVMMAAVDEPGAWKWPGLECYYSQTDVALVARRSAWARREGRSRRQAYAWLVVGAESPWDSRVVV